MEAVFADLQPSAFFAVTAVQPPENSAELGFNMWYGLRVERAPVTVRRSAKFGRVFTY